MRRSKSQPDANKAAKKEGSATPKRRWSSKLKLFRRKSNVNPDLSPSTSQMNQAKADQDARQIGEALDTLFKELDSNETSSEA